MSTAIENVHQTSFNMFVPCDLPTYRKLKHAYHLYTQHVRPWADRWKRAQYRIPKRRFFRFNKTKYEVQDSWVFLSLYEIVKGPKFNSWERQTERALRTTPLYDKLYADYWSARTPVKTAEEVKPLTLTVDELDTLLAELTAFVDRQRSYRAS